MRLVRRRDTAAERQLASALSARGLRFATHITVCDCTPDIVFSLERLAIFVDGDFWHGRILTENGGAALRKSFNCRSRRFWVSKITRNVERDLRQARSLRRNGWAVLRLWEKDIARNATKVAASIAQRLQRRRIRLMLGPDDV
jgi:DNA mismatch endonuclease (patch repair protein)